MLDSALSPRAEHVGGHNVDPGLLTLALFAGRQQRRAERAERRLLSIDQLFTRPDLDPAQARSLYVTARALGAAPGDPGIERAHDYTGLYWSDLAGPMGLSEATARSYVAAWTHAGCFERKPCKVPSVDAHGRAYLGDRLLLRPTALLSNVPAIPVPDKTPRQKRQTAQRQAKLAQCPHCGSLDVAVKCRECGAVTEAADLPETPAAAPRRQDDSSHYTEKEEGRQDESSQRLAEGPEAEETPPAALTPEAALEAAVAVLTPVLCRVEAHVTQDARQSTGHKYLDVKDHDKNPVAPTPALVRAHLQGRTIRGGGLCTATLETASGRLAQAVAWDADSPEDWGCILKGAQLLARASLSPLLSKNPSEEGHGHLWLLLDAPVDPTYALAAAERIAPPLARLRERFPDPAIGADRPGGRLRWPGGRYQREAGPPVNVLVALADEAGPVAWEDGTQPAGWAVIAGAVTPAALLASTWLPPDKRPLPIGPALLAKERARQEARHARGTRLTPRGEGAIDIKRWSADHPVPSLVEVDARGVFRSPWHEDRSPSCHYDADKGLWSDHSRGHRGGDAFDLWCALNGYWPDGAERPDRKGAYRALCPKESQS